LGANRLLHGVLLLAGGEPFFGQRQGGHSDLVVATVSRREQVPAGGFLVLGPHGVVQIRDGTLVHLRVVRFDVHLGERNAQQRRRGGKTDRLFVRLHGLGDVPVFEQHLAFELTIIGILREIPYQSVDGRQRLVQIWNSVVGDRSRVAGENRLILFGIS